jgi:cell division septal protein FtsQ
MHELFLRALPWLSLVLVVCVVAISFGLFGWFLFRAQTFTIQAITILDARDHTAAAAREIVAKHVAGVPLNRAIFFAPVPAMETAIARELAQVQTVHITRQLPGTIKVVIQEKQPALRLFSAGKYYLIDAQGIPYEEARLETLPSQVLPVVKNNDQGSTVRLGVPAVAPTFVEFVQHMQQELPKAAGAEIAEIRIPSLAAHEVYFILVNNWELKFDVKRPAAGQLTVLNKILETTIPPEKQAGLEYIDLRIPERVYYKTQETTARPVAQPIPTSP